ncbi:MAG: Ku protein [Pseudomonadota bacterium]|nr:Ku protein [Pseudomonadota bacterium]
MHRPIWKGFITFGLVNIPVTLYSAEKRSQLHFHLVDSRNKARIHYERVNDETGKEVPWDKVVKAFEYEKGNYIIIQEEELKNAAIEATQTIDIIHFVEENAIADIYFDKPYYLIPDKKTMKGYVLLREVLKRTGKVGIAKVVIRTRQYLCSVEACGNSLILNLMRYSNEIVSAEEFNFPDKKPSEYKITAQEIKLTEQLIAQMTAKWDAKQYKDDYSKKIMAMIEKKIKHEEKLPAAKKLHIKGSSNLIDFVSAIKKSLADKKAKAKKSGKEESAVKTHKKRKI